MEATEFLVKPFPLLYGFAFHRTGGFMRNWFFAVFLLTSLPSHAYYAVLDNAEVLPLHHYKLTGSGQALTDNGGLNLAGRMDAGFTEEFGIRGLFGFGKTDLYFGGLVKWIPIPDIEGQPAIGLNGGMIYARDNDVQDTTFRVEPLVSKKLNLDGAILTPYASLPVGIRMRTADDPYIDDNSVMTFQLVAGTQLQLEQWKKLQFIGELGVDLDNAPSHVSVGAIFYYDENGFGIE